MNGNFFVKRHKNMNKIIENIENAAKTLPKKKNWIRRIVYSALAVLIAVMGLQAYASYWLDKGGKAKIFNALSEAAGMEISAGAIKIGFGRLIARDIGLSANGKTFAEISELAVKPDYAKILRRQIAINGIYAKGVNLTLRRDKNGDFGLPWENDSEEKENSGEKTAKNDGNSKENSKNTEKTAKKEENPSKNGENSDKNGINTPEDTGKKPPEGEKPPSLPFRHLRLEQISGTYYDDMEDISMSFHGGILGIRDFSQEKPFRAMFAAKIRGKYKKFDIPETEISVKSRLSGPGRGGEGSADITRGKTTADLSFYIHPKEKREQFKAKIEFSAEDLEKLIPDEEIIKRYGLKDTDIDLSLLFLQGKIRAEKLFLSSGKTKISAAGDFLMKQEKGLYPLMLENLEISGLKSSYRKYKDGTDNMPEITSFIHWFFSTPSAVDFRLKKAVLKDIDLEYSDEKDKERYYLDGLNLVLENYASSGKFSLSLDTKGGLVSPWYSQKDLRITIKGNVDLKDFDMAKAYAENAEITVYSGGIPLMAKGNCKNFANPYGRARIKTAKGSSALPDFIKKYWDTNKYQAEADIEFDIPKKTAKLISARAEGMGSELSASGFYRWDKNADYSVSANGSLDLGRLGSDIEALRQYRLGGTAAAKISFSAQAADIQAEIKNGGFFNKSAGLFSGINTKITADPYKELTISTFTANLNGSPFTAGLHFRQNGSHGRAALLIKADKMAIAEEAQAKQDTAKKTAAQENSTEKSSSENAESEPGLIDRWINSVQTLDANAEIAVKHFDSSYFETYGLLLKADAAGLDRTLKNVRGNAVLSASMGGIKVEKDKIYSIKASHALILRAITSFDRILGVWQIIYKVRDMVSSKAKAIKKAQAAYPIPMERFLADIDIKNGTGRINDFYLTSDMFSFKAAGNIKLPEKQLDLSIWAAADKAPPDGVLPISLKITGPLEDIDATVGKTSTITSMVVQPFTNRGPISFLKKKLGITKKQNTRAGDYFRDEY